VVLGPHHPIWRKLYEALAALAEACGGSFAFVPDTGNGLWCVGLPGAPPRAWTGYEDRVADRFYAKETVPKMRPCSEVFACIRSGRVNT
jgi:hypothetical protein